MPVNLTAFTADEEEEAAAWAAACEALRQQVETLRRRDVAHFSTMRGRRLSPLRARVGRWFLPPDEPPDAAGGQP